MTGLSIDTDQREELQVSYSIYTRCTVLKCEGKKDELKFILTN